MSSAPSSGVGGGAADTEPDAEAIINRLARADLTAHGPDISRLLAGTDNPEATRPAWHLLQAARQLAISLWDVIPGSPSLADGPAG